MHPITSAEIARLHQEDLGREADAARTAAAARRAPHGSRARAVAGERYFVAEGRSIDQWTLIERLAAR